LLWRIMGKSTELHNLKGAYLRTLENQKQQFKCKEFTKYTKANTPNSHFINT